MLNATRGDSSRADQLAFVGRMVVAQLGEFPGLLRSLAGPAKGHPSVALRPRPDSAVAREADALAADAYPPLLLAHSLRCWYLADLFAQVDGIAHDAEALYVASLLHDIGLTERHEPPATTGCFAVHGGAVASEQLERSGLSGGSREIVERAIALHMDARVPVSEPVAHLLHAGAHCDVGGARAQSLPAGPLAALHERHPRGGFTDFFIEAMRREAHQRPGSRAAIMWRSGLQLRLRLNPLDRWY